MNNDIYSYIFYLLLVVYPEEILNTNCFGEFSSSCIVKANDVH